MGKSVVLSFALRQLFNSYYPLLSVNPVASTISVVGPCREPLDEHRLINTYYEPVVGSTGLVYVTFSTPTVSTPLASFLSWYT